MLYTQRELSCGIASAIYCNMHDSCNSYADAAQQEKGSDYLHHDSRGHTAMLAEHFVQLLVIDGVWQVLDIHIGEV